MKLTLFDHLNNLTENKVEWDDTNDDQTRSYDPYMTNRFVSMCQVYVQFINEVNKYNLPKDVHYNYIHAGLPKRKQYFKYMKKKGGIELSEADKKKLYDYFDIGPRQIEHYIDIMTEDQIKHILEMYNDGLQ